MLKLGESTSKCKLNSILVAFLYLVDTIYLSYLGKEEALNSIYEYKE